MTEFVSGYRLTDHEFDLEIGKTADPHEVKQQADLIAGRWTVAGQSLLNPTLIMLGGFQGSGKTTTGEHLIKKLGLITIAPDEIRYNLFSQNYPFSEKFISLVNAVKFELINRCLDQGFSAFIDQSLTPDRVNLTKEILANYPNYLLATFFLTAPTEVLIRRVSQRSFLPGKYQGKTHELEASIKKYQEKYGDPKNGGYDLVIDTTENKPEKITQIIENYLKRQT